MKNGIRFRDVLMFSAVLTVFFLAWAYLIAPELNQGVDRSSAKDKQEKVSSQCDFKWGKGHGTGLDAGSLLTVCQLITDSGRLRRGDQVLVEVGRSEKSGGVKVTITVSGKHRVPFQKSHEDPVGSKALSGAFWSTMDQLEFLQ